MCKSYVLFAFFILISAGSYTQTKNITLSGNTIEDSSSQPLAFVNVILKNAGDLSFVSGTISNENGAFSIRDIGYGNYIMELSLIGYEPVVQNTYVGSKSLFLNAGTFRLKENFEALEEVIVASKKSSIDYKMDKKTFTAEDNISQSGGTVLQSLQNLPGITIQDSKILLRGSSQVLILIDGKQTAITGFGNQNGLDNFPASSIDKIEIINNPSSKYDANGNAGIINIILKKNNQAGLNGSAGLTYGLGSLWEREKNLPGIRPQYVATPKYNPSFSLNYRKNKLNWFVQVDNLYTETLNKNEFTSRTYSDGSVINQQLKRNRNTNLFNATTGIDWNINNKNTLSFSGMTSKESIKDFGDQPFFNKDFSEPLRLWQFLEDEVLTAYIGTVHYEYLFEQPGQKLNTTLSYTFDREDEKYFFDNQINNALYQESFFLIADQKVLDFSVDYIKPLRYGLLELGAKFRNRIIPTNMVFNPSTNSPLDTNADGKATYKEVIPALYTNYIIETEKLEVEAGLRVEYINLNYEIDPNHNTYQSNGYNYFEPFPSTRVSYKLNDFNRFSFFYNRRVDRPDEVDIRIFPKYDDAEIIKVGNPALQPQFSNSLEIGYKNLWKQGYLYASLFLKNTQSTITRIATNTGNSNLIYSVSHNAGNSQRAGLEIIVNKSITNRIEANMVLSGYQNQIDAFSVLNKYPTEARYSFENQNIFSGNIKLNVSGKFNKHIETQIATAYLAPDIIPQGKIQARFSVDFGIKKSVQQNKGRISLNVTDLFNSLVIQKEINGDTFKLRSKDFYETQVVRLGYQYKF
jgi:outer membrane receptor protein involved in Fe transport